PRCSDYVAGSVPLATSVSQVGCKTNLAVGMSTNKRQQEDSVGVAFRRKCGPEGKSAFQMQAMTRVAWRPSSPRDSTPPRRSLFRQRAAMKLALRWIWRRAHSRMPAAGGEPTCPWKSGGVYFGRPGQMEIQCSVCDFSLLEEL
ncbi:unnamed protein product, partial [Prorocentrum cordatum]